MKHFKVTIDAISTAGGGEKYESFSREVEAFTPCMAKRQLEQQLTAEGYTDVELEAHETEEEDVTL